MFLLLQQLKCTYDELLSACALFIQTDNISVDFMGFDRIVK
jgi:hypothetical protein